MQVFGTLSWWDAALKDEGVFWWVTSWHLRFRLHALKSVHENFLLAVWKCVSTLMMIIWMWPLHPPPTVNSFALESLCNWLYCVCHRYQLTCYVKKVHWDCTWEVSDDSNLLKGVYEYGMGSWEAIKMDTELKLHDKVRKITPTFIQ